MGGAAKRSNGGGSGRRPCAPWHRLRAVAESRPAAFETPPGSSGRTTFGRPEPSQRPKVDHRSCENSVCNSPLGAARVHGLPGRRGSRRGTSLRVRLNACCRGPPGVQSGTRSWCAWLPDVLARASLRTRVNACRRGPPGVQSGTRSRPALLPKVLARSSLRTRLNACSRGPSGVAVGAGSGPSVVAGGFVR
jgi:hypothetical protein